MWRLHWQNLAGWTPFVGIAKPKPEWQDFDDREKAEAAQRDLAIVMPDAFTCITRAPHPRVRRSKPILADWEQQGDRKLTK